MFAKTIIDSDAFLDMPVSTQVLYFHLGMRADDDGFVNNPKKIMRMVGASDSDLTRLVDDDFIIQFESGIVVITHWKLHNYIQSDRRKETIFKEELAQLKVNKNKAYEPMYPKCIQNVSKTDTKCIQNVSTLDTQDSIGKDSIGKDNINTFARSSDEQSSVPKEKSNKKNDEPEADVSAIPLNDGTDWRPSETLFAEYVRLYPSVDVKQEFNKMRAWCLSNEIKKKSRRGVKKFINNWLSRQQDKGQYNYRPQTKSGYSQDIIDRLISESREEIK
ncbi:MAG: hypothetical protein IJ054_02780 [Lachnospiraceae bacterium]|nr:hypothetical protein [Lachnospiraceae bacterium]